MIPTIFAPPQPEAFAAKAIRTAPDSGREPAAAPDFADALRKFAPAAKDDHDVAAASTPSETAPVHAQESSDEAQDTDIDAARVDDASADDAAVDDVEALPVEEAASASVVVESPKNSSDVVASSAPVASDLNGRAPHATEIGGVGAEQSDGASRPLNSLQATTPESADSAQEPAKLPNLNESPAAASATDVNTEATEAPAPDAPIEASAAAAQQPQSAPNRRANSGQSNREHTVDSSDAAAGAEKPADTTATQRVQPIETAQATIDAQHRPGESRSFNDLIQRAESGAPSQTPTPESSAENKLFTAQVSRGLEAALRQNGGAVTIRLKPETLGALRIDLQVQQGSISAQFEASTVEARELLNKNLTTLRAALEAKGFGVRSVEVQVASPSQSGHANNEFGRSMSEGHAQPRDAGANGHGQTSSRREDPGGFSWDQRSHDALSEDALVAPGWRSVYVGGSLNAIA